jgi:hypothetical protein
MARCGPTLGRVAVERCSATRRRRKSSQDLEYVGFRHAPRDQRPNYVHDIKTPRPVTARDLWIRGVDHAPVSTTDFQDRCIAQIDRRREHETADGLEIGSVSEQANHRRHIP